VKDFAAFFTDLKIILKTLVKTVYKTFYNEYNNARKHGKSIWAVCTAFCRKGQGEVRL